MTITNARILGAGIDYATYSRQDPAVKRGDRGYIMSRGELMEFAHCPARWLAGFRGDDTRATEWGSLIDCLVLTPGEFEKRYAVSPATYNETVKECPGCGSVSKADTCRACDEDRVSKAVEKKWNNQTTTCKDWNTKQVKAGKLPLKFEDKAEADVALAALSKDEQARALVAESDTQVMVIGECVVSGVTVPLRCLIDLVPDCRSGFGKSLADFKTSTGASLDFWGGQVYKQDYDAQAALELDLYNAATTLEDRRNEFRHIIQESFPPYQTARRILSDEYVAIGRQKYHGALERYAECLTTGVWPDYEVGIGRDGWSFQSPDPWLINKLTQ